MRGNKKGLSKRSRAAQRAKSSAHGKRGAGKLFEDLVKVQARLLAPNGCPWDREQTHESLRPFLVEEAYEVLDALDSRDKRKFASELGDLLLQIVFHAELAKEAGEFDISDVIRAVHSKMVRRHPHVFGRTKACSSAEVLKNWEQIKAEERAEEKQDGKVATDSVLSGIPDGLPALLEAYQLSRRASNVGFDWENAVGILEKVIEEVDEIRAELRTAKNEPEKERLKVEDEIGDLLFAVVNLARFESVDPERALKRANQKFKRRFQWMEGRARKKGSRLADVSRTEMDDLWDTSKAQA